MNRELKDKILGVINSKESELFDSKRMNLTPNQLKEYLNTFKKIFPERFIELIPKIINNNTHNCFIASFSTLGDVICNSFNWDGSPEGDRFWSRQYEYFAKPKFKLKNFTKIIQICMPDE